MPSTSLKTPKPSPRPKAAPSRNAKLPSPVVLDDGPLALKLLRPSPDGRWLLGIGGWPFKPAWLYLWDADSLALKKKLRLKHDVVWAMAIPPDSSLVALGYDRTVALYQLPSLRPAGSLPLMPKKPGLDKAGLPRVETTVEDLAFAPDGKTLAAACWDCRVKVWSLPAGRLTELTPEHDGNVEFVAFAGGALLSGMIDRLRVWDAKGRSIRRDTKVGPGTIAWAHAASADASRVVSASARGQVRWWDPADWSCATFKSQFKPRAGYRAPRLAISPDGALAAVGLSDRIIFLDPSGRPARKPILTRADVTHLAFFPDARRLAYCTLRSMTRRAYVQPLA